MATGENGLIVVNGEIHKKLRKLASPAFKLSSLRKTMPIIEKCGDRMVKLISTKCNQSNQKFTEIDVKEIVNKTTVDVIGIIAFGHDFQDSCNSDVGTFGSQLREWLDGNNFVSLSSILPFQKSLQLSLLKFSRYAPKMLQTTVLKPYCMTDRVHTLVENIIQKKIEEWKNGMLHNKQSLLDFILHGSDSLDICPKEIHDLLMTFLLAGHETSSLAITWTLYLLAKHPQVQDKCRQEVISFFRDHPNGVDWDDVKKLLFLNAVVHESLRLYPPIPWLNRLSLNADEIAGYYVPPNTDHVLLICEMHRNPKYWSNPDNFVPDRFLEPHDSIPWDAFMPFGDGVHKCIGYQLALTEINYFMAVLLKNFEFSIDPEVSYREFVIITMQPKPALKLLTKIV